jgi:hypothetical protein
MAPLDWARAVVLASTVVFWLIGFDIIYGAPGLRIRPQARPALARCGVGPANALRAAFLSHMIMLGLLTRVRIALPLSRGLHHRMDPDCVLHRAGTLDRQAPQLELGFRPRSSNSMPW